MEGLRIPYAFRIYFAAISIVKISSILNMFIGQLDTVIASYKTLGIILLTYQIFSYFMLILVPIIRSLWDVAPYIILIVIMSEGALLGFSINNEDIVVTPGYLIFTISNLLVLFLSLIAISFSPGSSVAEGDQSV